MPLGRTPDLVAPTLCSCEDRTLVVSLTPDNISETTAELPEHAMSLSQTLTQRHKRTTSTSRYAGGERGEGESNQA
jgi:hypothetical protein